MINSGIYKITNKVNNKFYIGSSVNLTKRKVSHNHYLNNNNHCNEKLQRAWNKYGKVNFIFEIVATCPPEYCIKLEQWFIDNLKPEYNICRKAASVLGIKRSMETKQKLSIARLGIKFSKETLNKMSAAKKGKPSPVCKKVYKIDMNNNYIEYRSIAEAGRQNNIAASSISNCVNNYTSLAGGFKWKFSNVE